MSVHRWSSIDPKDIGTVLLADFSAEAGAQALFRAFLFEQDKDRVGVRFWLAVYEAILEKSA
jgi:hypothetical protein